MEKMFPLNPYLNPYPKAKKREPKLTPFLFKCTIHCPSITETADDSFSTNAHLLTAISLEYDDRFGRVHPRTYRR